MEFGALNQLWAQLEADNLSLPLAEKAATGIRDFAFMQGWEIKLETLEVSDIWLSPFHQNICQIFEAAWIRC